MSASRVTVDHPHSALCLGEGFLFTAAYIRPACEFPGLLGCPPSALHLTVGGAGGTVTHEEVIKPCPHFVGFPDSAPVQRSF